jgi:hypothetical protein
MILSTTIPTPNQGQWAQVCGNENQPIPEELRDLKVDFNNSTPE